MQINRHVVTIFKAETWLKLISILESINYSFVQLPQKIAGSDARDLIGVKLTEALEKM